MKQGKYISSGEKREYKLATVNLPLPNMSLSLFIEGRQKWIEGGLLVPTKKIKDGELLKKDHPRQPKKKEKVHSKLTNHHMDGSRCRQDIMEVCQCKHGEWDRHCDNPPRKIMYYRLNQSTWNHLEFAQRIEHMH
jgi:hypothetical protein